MNFEENGQTERLAPEALRLHEIASGDPDLELAEKMLGWLRSSGKRRFALVYIYQSGPHSVRVAKTARRVVRILEDHGSLTQLPNGTEIDGTPRKEAWELAEW